ncbi:metallophosphoesterase family protein [Microbacterium sp. SORGH_AS_0862]|uniref:purple acid phosphatase family protein n=1 Tax=Microbacterium sp. SORGH_AS_0862 TaxID=3041789 RepID=UPI002790F891|nr:metallophosphoesterase family protein [Microbacterium sp. SORGH_AS_0862]MDQ1204387.1 hypothetical protein [Microbacterium sp. SORGH_AS_0862]
MPRIPRPVLLTAGCLAVAVGLSSFGGGVAVAAGGGLAPPAVDPASVHRPSAMPDRIVLTPTATPATSQSVTWRTGTEVTEPQVQWAPSGPSLVSGAQSLAASTRTEFDTKLGYSVVFHSATIEGLTADTSYVYRVGDGETWSEWFEFRTADDAVGDFSFIVQGDAQNDNKAYTSRAFRAAFEARPYAQLAVHLGDLVDTETSDAEWGEWNEAGELVNQYTNLIATTGNHEYYPGPDLSQYWPAQFSFPENGPEVGAHPETVYYVDYQGVRFISLNSNLQDADAMRTQSAWLDAVLTENSQPWTVVSFHHPVFSASGDRDNALIRDAWLPILEKHDVDLVLQGHDHTYARGNLVSNEQNLPAGADPATDNAGPVYLVTVAGPKDYGLSPDGNNNWTQNGAHRRIAATNQQMYQTVDVTSDGRMHVEARTVDGALFDAFTIDKEPDGAKLVTTDGAWPGGPGSSRDGVKAPVGPSPEPSPEPSVSTEPSPDPSSTVSPEPSPSTSIPETGGSPAVTIGASRAMPGDSFTVAGSGFMPGEEVVVELHSAPVVLARTTADANGAVAVTVTIPASTPAGAHEIVLVGTGSGRTARTPLTVGASAAQAGALAATGAPLPVSLMIFGGALTLGGGAIVARTVLRNRKAS